MQFFSLGSNSRIVYADLTDTISLINAIQTSKPDYVFSLAAQSYPLTSFESPIDTYNTNILGTARLLKAFRKLKLDPVIYICASSEVFGKVAKEKRPLKEDCNFHPASPYAISKIGTDLLGRYHAEAYNQKVLTTRMFTHTGPRRGDVFAESSFAKQIAMIEEGLIEPIVKVGNLDSLRTYADVRDAVDAYYTLVTVNPIPGEYYNIGGSHITTIRDVLNTLLSMSPKKDEIEIVIDQSRLRPIDADLQIPDMTKFKNHTGWESKIPFEQTMKDLLDYWREKISMGQKALQR